MKAWIIEQVLVSSCVLRHGACWAHPVKEAHCEELLAVLRCGGPAGISDLMFRVAALLLCSVMLTFSV